MNIIIKILSLSCTYVLLLLRRRLLLFAFNKTFYRSFWSRKKKRTVSYRNAQPPIRFTTVLVLVLVVSFCRVCVLRVLLLFFIFFLNSYEFFSIFCFHFVVFFSSFKKNNNFFFEKKRRKKEEQNFSIKIKVFLSVRVFRDDANDANERYIYTHTHTH